MTLYPPFARRLVGRDVVLGYVSYDVQMDRYLMGRRVPGPHAGEPGYPTIGDTVTEHRPGESPHQFGVAAVLSDGTTETLDLASKGLTVARLRHAYDRRRNLEDVFDLLDSFGPW